MDEKRRSEQSMPCEGAQNNRRVIRITIGVFHTFHGGECLVGSTNNMRLNALIRFRISTRQSQSRTIVKNQENLISELSYGTRDLKCLSMPIFVKHG